MKSLFTLALMALLLTATGCQSGGAEYRDYALYADDSADLEQYRGKNRVILVFSPDEAHPQLKVQRSLAALDAPGFAKRDLILLEVVGAKDPLLRQRFDVAVEDFAALLIGKDGGEKLRSTAAISPVELFPTIDAMPMARP